MSFLNKDFHDRLFYGIRAIFGQWMAFKLAIDGHWGGYETVAKADWFVETMTDFLFDENDSLDIDDLESMLVEIMAAEFNVDLEDGSEKSITRSLLTLYKELRLNNMQYYNEITGKTPVETGGVVDMTKEDSDVSDDMA